MSTVDRGGLVRWAPAATVLGVVALTVVSAVVVGRSPEPSGHQTALACRPRPTSTEPVSNSPTSSPSQASPTGPTRSTNPSRPSGPPSPSRPPDCPPSPSPTSSATLPRSTVTTTTTTTAPPSAPSTCSGLIDQAVAEGPRPDREAMSAALLETLRRAGLAGQPSEARHPRLDPPPSEIRFDVTDAGGPGGIRIEVARYLDPAAATPEVLARTYDCLRATYPAGGRLGDGTPMPDVRRLPDGGTVLASDCAIRAGTRGCSQILHGATGLRVEIGAYLWAFSTDTGGALPPLTRTAMPLTVDEMLALAQAIEALG